jgi:hypothetical protein
MENLIKHYRLDATRKENERRKNAKNINEMNRAKIEREREEKM